MRSFVCGQCHVEYYCANKDGAHLPLGERPQGRRGPGADVLERADLPGWQAPSYDYRARVRPARPIYKVQHPEFELWSQGIHARSGVSCSDCHMPYERKGAMKLSSHDVRSPLEQLNNSCQTCHNVPEAQLRERVEITQQNTLALMERAAVAMTDMLDAIAAARAAGAHDEDLADVWLLPAQGDVAARLLSSENSRGFHADQEAARILGESIDYSRRAQAEALRWGLLADRRRPGPPVSLR